MLSSRRRRIAGAGRADQQVGQRGLRLLLIIRFRLWGCPQPQSQESPELFHSHLQRATLKHLLRPRSPRAPYLDVAGQCLLHLGRLAIRGVQELIHSLPSERPRARAKERSLDANPFCSLLNQTGLLLPHVSRVHRVCHAHLRFVTRQVLEVVRYQHLPLATSQQLRKPRQVQVPMRVHKEWDPPGQACLLPRLSTPRRLRELDHVSQEALARGTGHAHQLGGRIGLVARLVVVRTISKSMGHQRLPVSHLRRL